MQNPKFWIPGARTRGQELEPTLCITKAQGPVAQPGEQTLRQGSRQWLSWKIPDFIHLDREGKKGQGLLCSGSPLEIPAWAFILLLHHGWIDLKDPDNWVWYGKPGVEMVRNPGLTVWESGVQLKGASVLAQVMQVWLTEWLLDGPTGNFLWHS